MRIHAIFCALLLSSGALPAGAQSNVQPYHDSAWSQANCRFLILAPDGAYGNPSSQSLEGCIAGAEFGLMSMAETERAEEAKFHQPADVEFIDQTGAKHICHLRAKKEKFDNLPTFTPSAVTSPGYFDTLELSFKQVFDVNFEVNCTSPVT